MRTAKQWLLFCLLLEIVAVTYSLKFAALTGIASVVYVISGITIACLLPSMPAQKININFRIKLLSGITAYQIALLLMGGLFIFLFTKQWINQSPLSYKDADMIPIMEIMGKRFLAGNWSGVYDPVQEIWNGIQPIYLPAMWMPFLVAIKFGFDPRWVTSVAVFLSFTMLILLWRAHWTKISGAVLLFASGVLGLWLYTDHTHNFIRLSEEGIVVFYYSLLVLALLSENFLLVGVAAGLCVLSRYAIVGWLPAFMFYLLFIRKQKKATLQFILSFIGVIVLLVIIPFGIKPLLIAFQQPAEYIQHAERVWKESPAYFSQTVGLAKFFGQDRIVLQHTILLYASFLLPLLMVLGIRYLSVFRSKNNIALATLKLTLVIVFSLIDVPYQYLFYTASFVSLLAIAGLTAREEI